MSDEPKSSTDRFVDTDADIQIDPATLPENASLMAKIDEQLAAADAGRDVRKRLEPAFEGFLASYAAFGGHRYCGWNDYEDPRNCKGPMFWSEHDCAFRFALELEHVFPNQVHLELPVVRWSIADYEPGTTHQFIDLVVSDLSSFQEDDTSQARFKGHRHEAFIEVKYFPAGCSRRWKFDYVRKVPDVLKDAERLSTHYQARHCKLGLVLVVDDDGLFEEHRQITSGRRTSRSSLPARKSCSAERSHRRRMARRRPSMPSVRRRFLACCARRFHGNARARSREAGL